MRTERRAVKWVLQTDTDLPAEIVALRYRESWMVEAAFRDVGEARQAVGVALGPTVRLLEAENA